MFENCFKITMYKQISMLLLCVLFSLSALSKDFEAGYNMFMLGKSIGNFSVTQNNNNGRIEIKAITEVDISMLLTYRVKYVQHTIYDNGILQSSQVKTYKSGKLNSEMSMQLQNNSYLLVVDGDTSFVDAPITYSGSMVYFNEPIGITSIYKERTAEKNTLVSAGEHTYVVNNKKGKETNRYSYENGILQHATMKSTWGTIKMEKKNTETAND